MLEIQEQIQKLKLEIPKLDKILLDKNYSKDDLGKIEYFISSICTIAETTKGFNGSTTITRIRQLQSDKNSYYENLHLMVANTKALLDNLDSYYGQ